MKGKKRRILSSVCALFLAFLMIGQCVFADSAIVVAATAQSRPGSDAARKMYGDGWLSSKMITNVKVDKDIYIVGQDTKVVVSFDVRVAVTADDINAGGKLDFELHASNGTYYSFDYTTLATKTVAIKDLKAGENKVEIPVTFGSEEQDVSLWISQNNDSLDHPNIDVHFSVQKKSEDGSQNVPYTDFWSVKEQVSGVKLEKDTYLTGSEQTINISYNVAKLASKGSAQLDDELCFMILDQKFVDDDDDDEDDPIESQGNVIGSAKVKVSALKGGTNKITVKARFERTGAFSLLVYQDSFSVHDNMLPQTQFTVKAPTDDSGNVINTKGSVRPQYSVYSAKLAATMKIFYSINDSNSKYRLYVSNGLPTDGIVAEFMTEQGNLPAELGKEMSVTLNKTEKDFSVLGEYTVVLENMTTGAVVAQENFYVIYEKYVVQRDTTQMKDDGTVPFYCDADIRNFDLGKDEKYTFQVCFPLNMKKYMNELKNMFLGDDYDDDVLDGNSGISEFDEPFISDDYEVNMTVKYTPAGSDESRKLYKKTIKGLYKPYTATLSSKEILKKIYETGKNDISYAGVVTVQFSNEDDYQNIYNDAIIKFTEKFQFGVYKSASLTKAEASSSKAELAYGEYVTFNVNDSLGGKVIADIYKGSDKIDTVEGKCRIKSDGTADGEVDWYLLYKNNNYVEPGEYTAKIRTENDYTVFDQDGTTSQKHVKSEEKSVKISVVKPNRSLTLSASVSGGSGGNIVYVEQPNIGVVIKANIGVSVIVSVKGGGGEIKNCSAICRRGQRAVSMNLSGSRLKPGNYKVVVSAETLDGKKKTATATFHVKKLPKSSISSASLSVNNGLGNVSFKISELANVTVTVKSGSKVMQTVLDQAYSSGAIKTSFSIGGYKPGNYSVVIKTKNSGGSNSVTRTFTIKKKPVIVKKPTISGLSIRVNQQDGDMVKGTFSYTGKNSKVIIDIMYNDTEEIVYTYQGVTKNDSGTFTYTWDGFKSNGFRCWSGNYTFRVHLVNSAGSTPYLRQDFYLGQG